jgi:hypothetical protein
VDLYIHSSIRLHGVVRNYLSIGITLPFFYYYVLQPICKAEMGQFFGIQWLTKSFVCAFKNYVC